MYQKLININGEYLMMSNVIDAANIGKNFRKMFHNYRGANNVGHNCICRHLH